MPKNNQTHDQFCQTCYRIACKQCEWVVSEDEVVQIQQGILTACPVCGWKPTDS